MSAKRPQKSRNDSSQQEKSVANQVAWSFLICIALAVVGFHLTATFALGAPAFQATIVLGFNLIAILMAGFELRSGSIHQRILWGDRQTVRRDTNPLWFWICWWSWLVLLVGFAETVFIGYWIESVRR